MSINEPTRTQKTPFAGCCRKSLAWRKERPSRRPRRQRRTKVHLGQRHPRAKRSPSPVRATVPKVHVPRSRKEPDAKRGTVPALLSPLKLLLLLNPASPRPSEPERPRHRCWIHLPIQVLNGIFSMSIIYIYISNYIYTINSIYWTVSISKPNFKVRIVWACCSNSFGGTNMFECLLCFGIFDHVMNTWESHVKFHALVNICRGNRLCCMWLTTAHAWRAKCHKRRPTYSW